MTKAIRLFHNHQPGGSFWADDKLGSVFYVGSAVSGATDGTAYGLDPATPFATLAYALTCCTANAGDTIYLLPGHNEGIADATLAIDVAGVQIIGIGEGSKMPRFDFDHANANWSITGANVVIDNVAFLPSVTAITAGINVTSVVGVTIRNCWFMDGEDGGGVDEFAIAILAATGSHYLTVENCKFYSHASAAHITDCIQIYGNENVIRNNILSAKVSNSGISDGGACLRTKIIGNTINTAAAVAGIKMNASTTGTVDKNMITAPAISSADAAIVAAAMGWGLNYVCATAGAAPELVGTAAETTQAIGTEFSVVKAITMSGVVTVTGADITGTATGTLKVKSITIEKDSTGADSAGHAAVLNLKTNNTNGSLAFATYAQAKIAANSCLSLPEGGANATSFTGLPTIQNGKKLTAVATTEAFTGADVMTVTVVFERLSAGATIAAA